MSTHHTARPSAGAGATTEPATAARNLLSRWPAALGVAVAVLLLSTGAADRTTLAIGVSAAALCYLAAAAFGRPWIAWVSILAASLVVLASELVGLAWWAGVGITALALLWIGVARGAARPTLTQATALLGFGAVAVTALAIDPRVGLWVAGLALAGHAVWDVIHHRRNEVVPRSMAEACLYFDVLLGLGCIALAVLR
ncbi:hypothetical protein M1843_12695 [Isoptericola sp. 4D.3]|uniref:Uncharacterized protein n=1 Tax=Isoptericola peretonis TaxID=2918523 RepID=A0ABT0J530_9MICO|nr:hypothetical protein [Isoptericola sp. 4D.3]